MKSNKNQGQIIAAGPQMPAWHAAIWPGWRAC